jgi:hypothetical protein
VTVAKFDHAAIEIRLFSASGPYSQHLTVSSCMTIDKAGKQFRVSRLIDQIATENQIKLRWLIFYAFPVALEVGNRIQVVKPGVEFKKLRHFRVPIRGGDIGVMILQRQAGQSNAAANLKNSSPSSVEAEHAVCKNVAGSPDDAEMWPGSGRDSCLFRVALIIRVLIQVSQGAQMDVEVSDLNGLIAQPSCVHEHIDVYERWCLYRSMRLRVSRQGAPSVSLRTGKPCDTALESLATFAVRG